MRYIDSGHRAPTQAVSTWLQATLTATVTEVRVQSGFFSLDGLGPFIPTLSSLSATNGVVHALIGSNENATLEAHVAQLASVMGIPRPGARLGIVCYAGGYFHPKVYHIRRSDGSQAAYVGSANMTLPGLAGTHVEAGLILDTDDGDPSSVLDQIALSIDNWFQTPARPGFELVASEADINRLRRAGILAAAPAPPPSTPSLQGSAGGLARPALRPLVTLPSVPMTAGSGAAPSTPRPTSASGAASAPSPAPGPAAAPHPALRGFVMTLQRTDVGVGQTTRGSSRRSPEIFVPLAARDADPAFWDWPESFIQDPSRPGKFDRHGVHIRIGGSIVAVNIMTWPAKHDFRLRSEALRSAGNVGDILRIEKVRPEAGFDYSAEVIPVGSAQFATFNALCTLPVKNSQKRYGYY